MANLPLIEPTEDPAELSAVFEQLRATRGRVPAMYRMLAHQPAILAAHRAYFHAALDAGAPYTETKPAINGTTLSCGHRQLLLFKALDGRGAGAREAIVKEGVIRRRVRFAHRSGRCADRCEAVTAVREARPDRYAVESTISILAELRCLT